MPGEPAAVTVRTARLGDWPALRDLRLEALADTPLGFLERHEDALLHDEAQWQARMERWLGPHTTLLLAERDGLAVGMAGSSVDPSWVPAGTAFVLTVYLRPAARGGGVLALLVDAVARWAGERGAATLQLEVHEDNGRARAAYAKLGFAPTGARVPYPLDPSRDELVLTRAG